MYKDLIYILQTDELLTREKLQDKGEKTFENDRLVEWSNFNRGTSYREVREYCTDHHLVRYYFISRIYSPYMESVLNDFRTDPKPDAVIFNSCLWDLNRYNDLSSHEPALPKAIREYHQNLMKLFEKLDSILPQTCLAIWNTALPIREKAAAKGLYWDEKPNASPRDVIEANFYGAKVASSYDFNVLDLHFHFRFQEKHREEDGVHWNSTAHRFITKWLLTYMADAWGVQLEERRPQIGIEWNGHAANWQASPPPPLRPLQLQWPSSRQSSPHPPPAPCFLPHHSRSRTPFYFHYNGTFCNRPVGEHEQMPPPFLSQLNRANDPYFQQNATYSNGPIGGFECEEGALSNYGHLIHQPLDHQNEHHGNGPLGRLEYNGQGLPPHPGQFNPDHQDGLYDNRPVCGLEYNDQGPPPLPGQFNPDHHDGLYDNRPMCGPEYNGQGPPPHPGQFNPDHQDGLYDNRPVCGLEYNGQGAPPHPGQFNPNHQDGLYDNRPMCEPEYNDQGPPPHPGQFIPDHHDGLYDNRPMCGPEYNGQGPPPHPGQFNPDHHDGLYDNRPMCGPEYNGQGPPPHPGQFNPDLPPLDHRNSPYNDRPMDGAWNTLPHHPQEIPRNSSFIPVRGGQPRRARVRQRNRHIRHRRHSHMQCEGAHPYAWQQNGGGRTRQHFHRASC
ncbi:uncharacterized protein LOC133363901 isoform X2 [Rhineura floridana]|nr:uncharacterized protein LOC133363901 isoform X2 [Rhineura floridana]